jgi:hypothetical protein
VTEDKQRPEEVWTNGYAAVYHLNDDPAGTIKDAKKEHNGTSKGGMNQNDSFKEGKIGGALDFDGSNDYVNFPSFFPVVGNNPRTVSMWLRRQGDSGGGASGFHFIEWGSSALGGRWSYKISNGNVLRIESPDYVSGLGVPLDEWAFVAITFEGTQLADHTLYLNNNSEKAVGTGVINTGSGGVARNLRIGAGSADSVSAHRPFNGLIDSVRISSLARTPAWISTEYTNQANTDNFLTISDTVESHPSGSGSTITLKSDRPLSYTSLTSFTPNGSNTNTYQLSPDKGKTWYYYSASGWLKTTTASSSANDITNHLQTFPVGTNQLLWKAFIPSGNTLDSITITYTPSPSNSLSGLPLSLNDPRIQVINELHRQVKCLTEVLLMKSG